MKETNNMGIMMIQFILYFGCPSRTWLASKNDIFLLSTKYVYGGSADNEMGAFTIPFI